MKTIALCSTARSVGKTTVGAFLCRQLGTVAAVKVMPRHRLLVGADLHRHPRGDDDEGAEVADVDGEGSGDVEPDLGMAEAEWEAAERASVLGAGQDESVTEDGDESAARPGYLVVDDPGQLLLRGSDTRRFWDAGAEPVIWVRARDEQVLPALIKAREQIAAAHEQAGPGAPCPSLLLVESNRYVREGGDADVTLLVYPNGSEELGEASLELLPRADALVVSKRRPGPMKLALLDDERFPADKFDLPAFAFNLNEDSLALDDRFALIDWLRRRLDLNTINADEACRAI